MDCFGDNELFEQFEGEGAVVVHESSSESDGDALVDNGEYQELLHKYLHLKKSTRHFLSPANIKIKERTRDGPIAHVVLFNHAISRKYHEEIKEFFSDLCQRQVRSSDDKAASDIQPTIIQYGQPEKQAASKISSKRAEAKTKAFQAFSSVHLYDRFYIDQIGEPVSRKDEKLSCSKQPQFDQSQFEPLAGDNDSSAVSRKTIQRICFNCGKSDHQIKDCDKKRDQRAINDRRKQFMDNVAKVSGGGPQHRIDGGRYHKDDEGGYDQERFASFKPGVVSASLQEALGMKEEDLPPFIYRMRLCGYPPGHMRNAQNVDSGLSLFEEGELDGADKNVGYVPVDVSKLISFPGFNTPPLPGQVDKSEAFNVPPMNPHHSIENMTSYFEKRNELHKKQTARQNGSEYNKKGRNTNDADIVEVDMETDNNTHDSDTDMSQSSEVAVESMEDSNPPGVDMSILEVDVSNLTEDELNAKREMLLQQLERQESIVSRDSDYRDIIGKDQDYRKLDEIITIEDSCDDAPPGGSPIVIECDDATDSSPVIKDSPDSPVPDSVEGNAQILNADHNSDTHTSENPVISSLESEGTLSSDTDYRLHHSSEPTPSAEDKSPTEQDMDITDKSQTSKPNASGLTDGEKKLPDREKFAEGISRFDRYYEESKPQGTYLKLKGLLKDSPRRQEK